jgi:hypothetical protein
VIGKGEGELGEFVERGVIRTAGCGFTHYPCPGASDVAEGALWGVPAQMFIYLFTWKEEDDFVEK